MILIVKIDDVFLLRCKDKQVYNINQIFERLYITILVIIKIPLRTGVLRGMVLLGNQMPQVRRYVRLFAVWLVFMESCEDKHFA